MEIECIDILLEVALLSGNKETTRIGNIEALYHVFVFMEKHKDMWWQLYDSKKPDIDKTYFVHNKYWTGVYGDV